MVTGVTVDTEVVVVVVGNRGLLELEELAAAMVAIIGTGGKFLRVWSA
ncbi:hypothetical protein [Corynebacterium caspium]|nr:hypothetical protein [Corynebacterium caspium]